MIARARDRSFFQTPTGAKAAVIALDDTSDESSADCGRITAAIAEARRQASFVLIFVHWGEENIASVTERQRQLARWLIDQRGSRLVPVQLDARGFPQLVTPVEKIFATAGEAFSRNRVQGASKNR